MLCQAKVIRGRPVAGLAHGVVFWSAWVFAAVSIDHLLQGFGIKLLSRGNQYGVYYHWFAFLFAGCGAISIMALAVRRCRRAAVTARGHLVRPRWLEPLSKQSGFAALLIFVLLTSYMASWWMTGDSAADGALWWTYTVALLINLSAIPYGKQLHLLLSPIALLLKSEGFSRIPPLSEVGDVGLVSGKDLTRTAALQAFSCVECGRCTEHCPASSTGKELNPKLIALGVRDYLERHGTADETPILQATISETAIFQCTTCGACEQECPVGVEHLPMIIGLRRGVVNSGSWGDAQGAQLFRNLEQHGNSMGLAQSERDRFIAEQALPVFNGTQEYCLWLGCMGAYDANGRKIITAFAEVMKYLGASFGVLRKERCTGDPARRLGNDLVFAQLAGANLGFLRQAGVKKIVSICPHCVRTMAEDWNELGADLSEGDEPGMEAKVEHHSEFMARHADKLPAARGDERVVFHDPCYLGRYRGIYDEPRKVIAKFAEVVEAPRNRERSFCCGAGGGLMFLGEEHGGRVNDARARELSEAGEETVGAACPFCSSALRDALDGSFTNPPKLLDIAQIAAEHLRRKTIAD